MTEPGRPAGRPSGAADGLLAALAGLLLVLAAVVVGAVPAAAGNRVGASTPVMINTVGSSTNIGAGQRLARTVPQPSFVVATGVAAEGTPRPVIVDTNSVFNRAGVEGALNAGETPVMTQTTCAELRNLVARGPLKMPRFAGDLDVIPDVMDVNSRIAIRGMMRPGQAGLFGDGSIGATGLARGLPVITADTDFASVLQQLGVEVRLL